MDVRNPGSRRLDMVAILFSCVISFFSGGYNLYVMPAKKRAAEQVDGVSSSKPKKGRQPKAYKMPPPLPMGEVLTALDKSQWKIGTSVGKGGFGEIYSASMHGYCHCVVST